MIQFKVLIALFWIIWLLYWGISAIGVKRSISNKRRGIGIGIRLVIAILVLSFLRFPFLNHYVFAFDSDQFYNNPNVALLGVIIATCGFILAIWARICLGKNWGQPMSLKEKPDLVTKGPYAYIRHPIYTGIIIAMLGTIFASTIFWIFPFIFLTIYFIYSLKIEEKDMIRQFPKEYSAYIKRTKALIPLIY